MWVDMKPYINLPYRATTIPYTLGISSQNDYIDQRRNTIRLKPGYHLSVQVISNVVTTTANFDNLDPSIRECKSHSETEGLKSLNQYTKVGCEFECAAKKASNFCKCLPWFIPTDFKGNLELGGEVKKFEFSCLNLISSPSTSMKIQIVGGKITENLGFESSLRKVKKMLSFFLFIF